MSYICYIFWKKIQILKFFSSVFRTSWVKILLGGSLRSLSKVTCGRKFRPRDFGAIGHFRRHHVIIFAGNFSLNFLIKITFFAIFFPTPHFRPSKLDFDQRSPEFQKLTQKFEKRLPYLYYVQKFCVGFRFSPRFLYS